MDPDHLIATLDKGGKLDMEVQIERGRGYVPAEMEKGNSDVIGVIPIDALFSPVTKVNVDVVDTRVGQRADYDKLILEVNTDGTVRPEDALAQAAKILKDHLTIFINFEEDVEEESEVVDENIEKMKALLSKSIDEMEFSVRSYNTLKTLEIATLDQLVHKTEDELTKSKHYSDQVLDEVKSKLEAMHLSLGLKD
jgi:DNA-directed RNA polymerase subunit alpha